MKFDYYRFNYYFFTIKFNTPYLEDEAHDMVTYINYIKLIILNSTINKVVYCFELDSRGHLHVHGICATADRLIYKQLYRMRGVHHKFTFIEPPAWHDIHRKNNDVYLASLSMYMLKSPIGKILINQFKTKYLNNVSCLAYHF